MTVSTTSRTLWFSTVTRRSLPFFTEDGHVPAAVQLDAVNVGDVHRLRLSLRRDGEPWDLTAGSAALTLTRPDGTTLEVDMTAEDADAGIFYYDTLTSDLDQPGDWAATVVVTDGDVVKTYPGRITLPVEDA